MAQEKFYCPLYEGEINQYDCDEIQCGANTDYIPNDGLPQLLSIDVIRSKKEVCLNCKKNGRNAKDIITQMVDGIAKNPNEGKDPTEMIRIEEQRKRLAGRAMDYLMFLDDDDE